MSVRRLLVAVAVLGVLGAVLAPGAAAGTSDLAGSGPCDGLVYVCFDPPEHSADCFLHYGVGSLESGVCLH